MGGRSDPNRQLRQLQNSFNVSVDQYGNYEIEFRTTTCLLVPDGPCNASGNEHLDILISAAIVSIRNYAIANSNTSFVATIPVPTPPTDIAELGPYSKLRFALSLYSDANEKLMELDFRWQVY